jgi:hypothetical protein
MSETAKDLGTAVRVDRDHLVPRFSPWWRSWSGWARPNRASASTASTSRPTRFTNRWVRTEVVDDLVAREPHLDREVVFGIRARDLIEYRLAAHLMDCWTTGRTSLRRALS